MLGALIFYIRNNYQEFIVLKRISWKNILIIFLFFVLGVVVRSWFIQLLMRSFEKKLKLRECFGITIFTSLGDYFLPFGGFSGRGFYFKKLHNLSYAYYLSFLMATYFVYLTINSFIGLFSLLLIYLNDGIYNIPILIILVLILLVCFYIVISDLKIGIKKANNAFLTFIYNCIDGWKAIKNKEKVFLKLSVLTLLRIMILALIVYFSFLSYGYEVSLRAATFIASMTAFGMLLKITPSSLGLQEGVIVLSSKFFGFSVVQGLLVAGLVRILNIASLLLLAFCYSLLNWLNHNKK